MTVTASRVERLGLFAIIVLGEVIEAVVQGVAGHHELTWAVGVTAAPGILIAVGLWWLYFDFVSHRKPLPGPTPTYGWYFCTSPRWGSPSPARPR